LRVVILIGPLVDAHLAAGERDRRWRPLLERFAAALPVDRQRGLVALLDRPDDVLGALRSIAAEEHARQRGLKGLGIDLGLIPTIEAQAHIALDPGERILLADRQNHIVAGNDDFAEHPLGADRAAL